MEQLEEILSVEGVDMVNFGPCDYALSLGRPGQRNSPDIQKKERDMIELALKKGIQPRIEIGSFEQAKEYIDMGVRHFCIGFDLVIFYQWCQQQREGMQRLLASV